MNEEITPTLEALRKERSAYIQWKTNQGEIEYHERVVHARQYHSAESSLAAADTTASELAATMAQLDSAIAALEAQLAAHDGTVRDATRDARAADELAAAELEKLIVADIAAAAQLDADDSVAAAAAAEGDIAPPIDVAVDDDNDEAVGSKRKAAGGKSAAVNAGKSSKAKRVRAAAAAADVDAKVAHNAVDDDSSTDVLTRLESRVAQLTKRLAQREVFILLVLSILLKQNEFN